MGQWSADYYDDVLKTKVKSMVTGAIKRSKLQKTDPKITYERFVEELDAGDSFTSSIIDTLVKELAERRNRQSISDRRYISERTAKELRQLSASSRIYRDYSYGPRRHLARRPQPPLGPFADAIGGAALAGGDDSENEFDTILNQDLPLEGARMNSDLYDAYGGGSAGSSGWGSAGLIFSTRPPLGRTSASPSPPPPASSAALTRQPSIRRSVRSRTVDFNEFTSRRRNSSRTEGASEQQQPEPTQPPHERIPSPLSRGSFTTRRFFPMGRSYRNESTWGSLWSEDNTEERTDSTEPTPSSSHLFSTFSDERTPRLRRGGLRAPESLLGRESEEFPEFVVVDSPRRVEEEAYPTPGSMGPDSSHDDAGSSANGTA